MTARLQYVVGGLPPLPGTVRKQPQRVDELPPIQRNVVDTLRQAGMVASANVERFQEPLQQRADELSRKTWLTGQALTMNAALLRLWTLTWELDEVGNPLGFDPTGQLLIGVPWSWRQCGASGLRRGQCATLARFIKEWTSKPLDAKRWTPIYLQKNRWFINTRDFRTFADGVDVMGSAVNVASLARLEALR